MPFPSYISDRSISLNLRRHLRSGWIPAAAFLMQGILLLWMTGSSGLPAILLFASALAISALTLTGWKRRHRFPHLDALIVTAAAGGLGMLVGMSVDEGIMASKMACRLPSMPIHDMSGMGLGGIVWSWMTACMFLFCIPACRWLCDEPCRTESRGVRTRRHIITYGCMLGGMIAAAIWLTPFLHSIFHSSVVPPHLSMVAGMVAGTYLGIRLTR